MQWAFNRDYRYAVAYLRKRRATLYNNGWKRATENKCRNFHWWLYRVFHIYD